MHVIKAHEPSVTLFSVSGDVRIFASMTDALRQLGYRWISENVRAEFVAFSHVERRLSDNDVWFSRACYHSARYVMRDDTGAKLTAGDFSDLRRARRLPWWVRHRSQLQRWDGAGPVPYVHRPSNCSYYRRPRTLNERRMGEVVDDEPAPRAGRASIIPSDWDDRRVAAREVRNWKNFRRTQWKQND